jgi:cytosine deaminase
MKPIEPPKTNTFRLRNASLPATFLARPDDFGTGDVRRLDIEIERGRITGLKPAAPSPFSAADIDLDGGMVWPCFADIHTHLDKGHIWSRTANPDGSRPSAISSVARDRENYWSAGDVARRMEFGLRCAYAHGAMAVRTHLDSYGKQAEITWPAFCAVRDAWAGKIALEAVSLVSIESFRDEAASASLARRVSDARGILGAVTYKVPDLDALLDRMFALAETLSLDLDFHVDETNDIGSASLGHIAATALRRRFRGRIVVGHCCSLALQDADAAARTIAAVAEAGIAVVSLPMCNLYLQDRTLGRTPRWRGVTLLHEFAAHHVPVMLASDNCRDPFYAYGDHDPLEVYTQATRIAHLDHPFGDWPRAITLAPARMMGIDAAIAEGSNADLVVFSARSYNELLSRPQTNRLVLRAGRPIDQTLPDYRELDSLFSAPP